MVYPDLSDSIHAAKQLIGYTLAHYTEKGLISGHIVETEAYHTADPASHSWRGQTERNSSMFMPAGTLYVYFTYGMHYCVNIVTGSAHDGQGVLIRALEPVAGVESMRTNRPAVTNTRDLTNGPAKLTQALGIDKRLDGTSIFQGPVRLEPGRRPGSIITTTRVGIAKAQAEPYRFYEKDNPYVSKR